jgi:tRNA A37 threonylcarbamoyladenosine dehydratase
VAVFGLGGVGGHAFEALLRAGVGCITVVDADVFEASNMNRQLLATESGLGRPKVALAVERAAAVHPEVRVVPLHKRATPDNAGGLIPQDAGFVLDAIDDLNAKAALIRACLNRDIPVAACMGAARRFDPTRLRVGALSQTTHCPLARRLRQRLRSETDARRVVCVYSDEPAIENAEASPNSGQGSLSYIPGLIGLTAAGLIIRRIVHPLASPVA